MIDERDGEKEQSNITRLIIIRFTFQWFLIFYPLTMGHREREVFGGQIGLWMLLFDVTFILD